MMVTERQKQILNSITEEYINSAHPVSSELLENEYSFGISPATIRIEMQKLTEAGFLYQPHTSAGRVPTDKGYRFFVDNLREISESKDISELEEILREEKEGIFNFSSRLAKFLAEVSSNFAILYLLESGLFWKEGWEELIKEPEFQEENFISNFTKLLDNFERSIKDFRINPVRNRKFLNGVNSEIKIYIGKENPFSKAGDFGIMISRCRFPKRKEGLISILGPKRMAYDKNISLINSLTGMLEGF